MSIGLVVYAVAGGGSTVASGTLSIMSSTGSGLTASADNANWTASGRECEGDNGYDDLQEGAEINIYDAEDKLLASGQVDAGRGVGVFNDAPTDSAPATDNIGRIAQYCRLPFKVEDVPKADLYQVEIADRGKLMVKPEELQEISFSIGSR